MTKIMQPHTPPGRPASGLASYLLEAHKRSNGLVAVAGVVEVRQSTVLTPRSDDLLMT